MKRVNTVDAEEVARFAAMAATWWDADGPMRPLHKLNPLRLAWIKQAICARFARDMESATALAGLRILDVGCGAGLVTEPLARMGAATVGIDPSPEAIAAAEHHAAGMDLSIDYRAATAEDLAAAGESFDVVLALEVVEHVTDVAAFVATCATLLKPGGLMVASTINRTMKAWLLAIVGAEYVLRWLPRGTHSYEKFLTPDEIRALLTRNGLKVTDQTGVVYHPLADEWRMSPDMGVNYMVLAEKPAG